MSVSGKLQLLSLFCRPLRGRLQLGRHGGGSNKYRWTAALCRGEVQGHEDIPGNVL